MCSIMLMDCSRDDETAEPHMWGMSRCLFRPMFRCSELHYGWCRGDLNDGVVARFHSLQPCISLNEVNSLEPWHLALLLLWLLASVLL